MEPVRVKVYGLFARTRRRYLIESAVGVFWGLVLLAAWWLGWPLLRQRLTALELPTLLEWIVRVLDWTPWALLGAAICKGMEVLVVLRRFARKERSQPSPQSLPPT